MKKTLPTGKEFTLTDYQRGVISTLHDMVIYNDTMYVNPMRKALSTQLTRYAQENFNYPEGTNLQFDVDPKDESGKVTVTEVEDATKPVEAE